MYVTMYAADQRCHFCSIMLHDMEFYICY